tara:strand:+ start:2221 stop:2427 length:207 start_codon:yes stop_codon:yes gene_type:complete
MKKFKVMVKCSRSEIITYYKTVEAEDTAEAQDAAQDAVENGDYDSVGHYRMPNHCYHTNENWVSEVKD